MRHARANRLGGAFVLLVSACGRSPAPAHKLQATPSRAPSVLAPPPAKSAEPEPAAAVWPRSRYGRFEISKRADASCAVAFQLTQGASRALFSVPSCGGSLAGTDTLEASHSVGQLQPPLVAANGDEFHLFEIAGARGGNAFDGIDYWVVVARPSAVWSGALSKQQHIDSARLAEPATLVLEDPATTTSQGARSSIRFGSTRTQALPLLPSHVVSKATRVLEGEVEAGYHVTNFQPSIHVADDVLLIDDPGPCKFPEPGEPTRKARMKAEITTWSDERTTLRCLKLFE